MKAVTAFCCNDLHLYNNHLIVACCCLLSAVCTGCCLGESDDVEALIRRLNLRSQELMNSVDRNRALAATSIAASNNQQQAHERSDLAATSGVSSSSVNQNRSDKTQDRSGAAEEATAGAFSPFSSCMCVFCLVMLLSD